MDNEDPPAAAPVVDPVADAPVADQVDATSPDAPADPAPTVDAPATAPDAPDAAAPVPDPAPAQTGSIYGTISLTFERLDEMLARWISDCVHNSPVSRDTDAMNHMTQSAVPDLKARIVALF